MGLIHEDIWFRIQQIVYETALSLVGAPEFAPEARHRMRKWAQHSTLPYEDVLSTADQWMKMHSGHYDSLGVICEKLFGERSNPHSRRYVLGNIILTDSPFERETQDILRSRLIFAAMFPRALDLFLPDTPMGTDLITLRGIIDSNQVQSIYDIEASFDRSVDECLRDPSAFRRDPLEYIERSMRQEHLKITSGKDQEKVDIPPSLGTLVRTVRATGKPDLSNPQPEDHFLTQQVRISSELSDEAYQRGRKDGSAGKRIDENPYDLHKDSEALQHLSWLDGFHEVEQEALEAPDRKQKGLTAAQGARASKAPAKKVELDPKAVFIDMKVRGRKPIDISREAGYKSATPAQNRCNDYMMELLGRCLGDERPEEIAVEHHMTVERLLFVLKPQMVRKKQILLFLSQREPDDEHIKGKIDLVDRLLERRFI